MTPIDFGVTRSKVKVTVNFHFKMVSANYPEYYISQSLYISHDFELTRSKVTVTLNVEMVSVDYIEHYIYHRVFIFHM